MLGETDKYDDEDLEGWDDDDMPTEEELAVYDTDYLNDDDDSVDEEDEAAAEDEAGEEVDKERK